MAGKTAYLFPGQGAQSTGMGKDFFDNYPKAKDVFQRADQILGFSISKLCFEGPDESLMQTVNSQPAIYTTSWAIWEVLKDLGKIQADGEIAFAGLSLGEYSAHAACGTWSFEKGLELVFKRATAMQKAAEETNGTMASVLNLDANIIDEICANVNGIVQSANYNSPGQIVISGEKSAVAEASEKLSEAGARRVIPLSVSGAFHSPLMKAAEDSLRDAVQEMEISNTTGMVISNVTAKEVTEAEEIKSTIVSQLTSPVRWYQSIEYLIEKGFENFIELGPNNVLTGLMKRINKEANIINVKSVDDIAKMV